MRKSRRPEASACCGRGGDIMSAAKYFALRFRENAAHSANKRLLIYLVNRSRLCLDRHLNHFSRQSMMAQRI